MSSLLVASPQDSGAGRVVAPYITAWSTEQNIPAMLVERPHEGGIAYWDETLVDRDRHGVLWYRTPFHHGQGRPMFGKVHPVRQRRAMQRLLCQVCTGPADQTEDGVLWLLKDHRADWPTWPNGMGVTEPPVCVRCAGMSVRLCPALRKGAAAVRAGSFVVAGVHGTLYRGGPIPTAVGEATMPFEDPAIRWMRAMSLVRELRDCVIIPLITLAGE